MPAHSSDGCDVAHGEAIPHGCVDRSSSYAAQVDWLYSGHAPWDEIDVYAPPVRNMIALAIETDELCRGTSDPVATPKNCILRDAIWERLSKEYAMCFGRDGDAAPEMKWHFCP